MKKLKKYICVLAAALMLASFASFPVYAEPDVIPEETEDIEEEDPDELIPIEEDESTTAAPDDEDIDFIDPEDPAETSAADTTETPAETTEFVTPQYNAVDPYTMYATDVINVRYGPDTSYSKFGTLYAGAPVQIIGTAGNWLVIKHNGVTGFVSASFFSATAPETTTAATTAARTTAPQDTTEPAESEPAEPEDTTPAVTEAPEETTKKTKATEAPDAEETTKDENKEAAAITEDDHKDGGLGGLLIALGCAVGTFLLIGVIPVVIHSIYHKKLYQY